IMSAAQERGKLAIAYHSDMRKFAPDAQLLAVTHQWGSYYTRRAKAVLDGSWKTGSLWGGVKEGMICVDSFGPKVPNKVVDEVLARQRDIASGKLHPFRARAELLDNEGREVLAAGQTLSDEQILGMNFLVQGVQGKLNK
ncbi:MAG: BMP family ABC transporter substrate-binding protein, partial [Polaromonas sp.]